MSFSCCRSQLLCLLSLFLSFGLTMPWAVAQSLRVSPLVIQTQSEREQARGLIEVTNTGKIPLRARVYAVPFTYNRQGLETLSSSSHDLRPYLSFSPKELILEPNQTRTIRFNARFPQDVTDGEYRALLYLDQLVEREPNNTKPTVVIKTRLGITVYVNKGKNLPALSLLKATYEPQQRQIVLLVNNSGKVTVRPRTTWQISQATTSVAEGTNDETTVIANGDRYLTIPYPPAGQILKAGTYNIKGELNWQFPQSGNLSFQLPLVISDQDARIVNQSSGNKP